MDVEALVAQAVLNLAEHGWEVLGRDVVLHLLELARAWRSEEAMAVVRLGDRGDAPGRDTAHAARQWRRQSAQLRKYPVQAVLQQQLVERAEEIARGRGRVGLVEELRLYPGGVGQPKELEVAVLLLVAVEVGQAVAQPLAPAAEAQPLGRHHPQRDGGDHAQCPAPDLPRLEPVALLLLTALPPLPPP